MMLRQLSLRNLLLPFLLFSGIGNMSFAGTLLDVGGARDTGQSITANKAVAVSFTLGAPVTDVDISIAVTCISCSGGIYLLKNQIGPGTPATALVAAETYGLSSVNPVFSGLNLSAGSYFLVLDVDSGTAIWEGSSSPSIVSDPQVSRESDFSASSTPFPGYLASFGVIFNQGALSFTVSTPDPPVVPAFLRIARDGTSTTVFWDMGTATTVDLERSTDLSGWTKVLTGTSSNSYNETSSLEKVFFRLRYPLP